MKKKPAKSARELAGRYLKIVTWSEEDRCFVGRCPALMRGGVHGDDEAKVYADLCATVEEVIAMRQAHDEPLPPEFRDREFNGKFLLRCSPELHRLLAIRAHSARQTINTFAVGKLEEAV